MNDATKQLARGPIAGPVAAAGILFITVGCSSTRVSHDYDTAYDFARLKTYDWLELPGDSPVSALTFRRVQKAANAQLAAKGYAGSPRYQEYSYEEGSLIMDFVERTSKELVWRGIAWATVDRSLSPERREERINEAVTKLLKPFPPP